MKTSVLVPTFRRPDDLERCLAALSVQTLPADEVIVIARRDDTPTVSALERWLAVKAVNGLRVAWVGEPGQVAANNCGLLESRNDLILITDDDAAPHPDWIERIHDHFEQDPKLGGVGGRDFVHERGALLTGEVNKVGLVSWYGRTIGNHHLGSGAPRQVDVLKGVNMAWRREAVNGLCFDTRLLGSGAQVHNDLAFSLAVRKRGWKLVYDPAVRVDHYPAQRADDDQRFVLNKTAYFNAAYNYRFIVREHLGTVGRLAFATFFTLVGTRSDPGIVRATVLGLQGEGWRQSFFKAWISARATWAVFRGTGRRRGPATHHA